MFPYQYHHLFLLHFAIVLGILPRHLLNVFAETIIIDDQYGDPLTGASIVYAPAAAWQEGQTCQTCTAKPRPISDAYDGTWMDASFNPSGQATNNVPGEIITATVSFTGTSVYVQAILTGSSTSPDGNTDYTFTLDGTIAGVFQRSPNGDPSYQFNQTVFSQAGLSNTAHLLVISAGASGVKSLILLDSVIYTTVDGEDTRESNTLALTSTSSSAEPSSSSSAFRRSDTDTSTIVGAVGSGIAFLAILGILK